MSVAHFAHGVVDPWPPHSETGPLHCVACGACNGEGECWPMPIASRSDRHSPGLRPASWQSRCAEALLAQPPGAR
jgi:hypothetical protein